jgi:hypothetical protein
MRERVGVNLMWRSARLAIIVVVLSLGVAPGERFVATAVSPAMADEAGARSGGKAKAERSGGKDRESGKKSAERPNADKKADKARSGRDERKAERSRERDERRAVRRDVGGAGVESPAELASEASIESVPIDVPASLDGVDTATTGPSESVADDDAGEPEVPTEVDGPVPTPRDPEPTDGGDGAGEPEVPTQVDGPVPTPRDPEPTDGGDGAGEPEVPTQVDGPVPDTDGDGEAGGGGSTGATESAGSGAGSTEPAPTETAGSGGSSGDSGSSGGGSGSSGDSGSDRPSLGEVIGNILGGGGAGGSDGAAGVADGSGTGSASGGGESTSGAAAPSSQDPRTVDPAPPAETAGAGGSSGGSGSSGGTGTDRPSLGEVLGNLFGGGSGGSGGSGDSTEPAPTDSAGGSGGSATEAPTSTAGTGWAPAAGGAPAAGTAPATTGPTPLRDLQGLIGSILGGGGHQPRPAAGPTAAPVATAPTVAAAPTARPVATAVATPPVAAPAVAPATVAARQIEPQPKAAATAPRIEFSSGGSRGETYRQYELSALGLTPRARQLVGALGFRILSERRSPLLGNQIVARLRTPNGQTAEAALERVRQALPEVTFDLSHLYRPTGERVPVRYAAKMIGAPTDGACRIDARVGLIDTGVGNHAALANASITRKNFVDRNAATNVAHGTAIASILVGELPGAGTLMPGARLYSANVFAQDAAGLRADAPAIIEALDWMATQRVPVVNLSLMGPPNALLERAVRAAAERGLILVAAAGNDGPGAAPAYPAAYPEVIAVSAVDARGRPYGRNNRGAYVYVAAPGVDIWGADARGGVAFWTGTSFAAPFVTATVARDLAQGRARDINDGRARIASSARDLGAPGRDPIYGHGLLQVGGCTGNGGPGPVLSAKN